MHDPLLLTRVVTGVGKALTYGVLAAAFWRFRLRSEHKAVCLALTINFAMGAVLTSARIVQLGSGGEPLMMWLEITASAVTFVTAHSIIKSVWR